MITEKRKRVLNRRAALRTRRKAEAAEKREAWFKFCKANPTFPLERVMRIRYRTGEQMRAGELPERTLVRLGIMNDAGLDEGGLEALQVAVAKNHAEMHRRNAIITSNMMAEHRERNTKLELTLIDG